MSTNFVQFDVDNLNTLVGQIAQAGEEYSSNYQKMTALIENINNGTMTGPVADELKKLYDDKKETFQRVEQFVENNRATLQRKTIEGQDAIDYVINRSA